MKWNNIGIAGLFMLIFAACTGGGESGPPQVTLDTSTWSKHVIRTAAMNYKNSPLTLCNPFVEGSVGENIVLFNLYGSLTAWGASNQNRTLEATANFDYNTDLTQGQAKLDCSSKWFKFSVRKLIRDGQGQLVEGIVIGQVDPNCAVHVVADHYDGIRVTVDDNSSIFSDSPLALQTLTKDVICN